MRKPQVFVYLKDPVHAGNGLYSAIACFCAIDVHVPFTYHFHDGDRGLREVGEPIACDGSCKNRSGTLEDFSIKRGDHDYEVAAIVEKALAFHATRGK